MSVSRARSMAAAEPGGHSCNASYIMSSVMVKQSCTSAMSMSDAETLASAYAQLAADADVVRDVRSCGESYKLEVHTLTLSSSTASHARSDDARRPASLHRSRALPPSLTWLQSLNWRQSVMMQRQRAHA